MGFLICPLKQLYDGKQLWHVIPVLSVLFIKVATMPEIGEKVPNTEKDNLNLSYSCIQRPNLNLIIHQIQREYIFEFNIVVIPTLKAFWLSNVHFSSIRTKHCFYLPCFQIQNDNIAYFQIKLFLCNIKCNGKLIFTSERETFVGVMRIFVCRSCYLIKFSIIFHVKCLFFLPGNLIG